MIPIRSIERDSGSVTVTDLPGFLGDCMPRLPHVIRLLIENHLRTTGDTSGVQAAVDAWLDGRSEAFEFSFRPNRLLMQRP